MSDKALYSAFIAENLRSRLVSSFVRYGYRYARIEKCLLAHTVEDNAVIKRRRFPENLLVRHKTDVKPVVFPVTFADTRKGTGNSAAFKAFRIYFSFVTVFNLRPFRKRVYNRRSDSVQSSGEFISFAPEFSARVKHRKDYFKRRDTCLRVYSGGNAAAVIADGNASVLMKRHLDMRAYARHRLVYGVIHNFINEMMKSPLGGTSYIHSRTFADRLQSFKHLNLTLVINLSGFGSFNFFCHNLFLSDWNFNIFRLSGRAFSEKAAKNKRFLPFCRIPEQSTSEFRPKPMKARPAFRQRKAMSALFWIPSPCPNRKCRRYPLFLSFFRYLYGDT